MRCEHFQIVDLFWLVFVLLKCVQNKHRQSKWASKQEIWSDHCFFNGRIMNFVRALCSFWSYSKCNCGYSLILVFVFRCARGAYSQNFEHIDVDTHTTHTRLEIDIDWVLSTKTVIFPYSLLCGLTCYYSIGFPVGRYFAACYKTTAHRVNA